MLVVLSGGFTCNSLYKCIDNTLTSAPVFSFTVSLSRLPLAEISVSQADDFLILSICSGLRSNSLDYWKESLSLFEFGSLCAVWSVSCTSWSFHLDLMPVLESWSLLNDVFCDFLCLGRAVLLLQTLANIAICGILRIFVHMSTLQYIGFEPLLIAAP